VEPPGGHEHAQARPSDSCRLHYDDKALRANDAILLGIVRIFEEAGLPEGVLFGVCALDAADITAAIMEDQRVRKLCFTGSTELGKLLMKQAADTIKRLSLELGGHAPLTVFDDANLDATVEGAVASKMRNMGQTRVAAKPYLCAARSRECVRSASLEPSRPDESQGRPRGRRNARPSRIEDKALEKAERHVANAKEGR
jgi:succinate-semialdehyde dehydrogenase / glutarate-semialdehyde dehydrogenase